MSVTSILRKRSYRELFLGDDGKLTDEAVIVLRDLAYVCCFSRSIVVYQQNGGGVDVHSTLVLEGRRDTYLHILRQLNLPESEVKRLAGFEEIEE